MKIEATLPADIAEEIGRGEIHHRVVANVNLMLKRGKPLGYIDDYLLNEPRCTQEEREFITETIYIEYTTP